MLLFATITYEKMLLPATNLKITLIALFLLNLITKCCIAQRPELCNDSDCNIQRLLSLHWKPQHNATKKKRKKITTRLVNWLSQLITGRILILGVWLSARWIDAFSSKILFHSLQVRAVWVTIPVVHTWHTFTTTFHTWQQPQPVLAVSTVNN